MCAEVYNLYVISGLYRGSLTTARRDGYSLEVSVTCAEQYRYG